jgi:hypothetical protein
MTMPNTNFANDGKIGVKINETSTTPLFALGETTVGNNGSEWVYVRASATINAFDVVTFDETYATVVAPISTANDFRGDKIGVAPVAFVALEYGWLQIKGLCTMNVLASCAANVRLNTTGTAGFLDDDGTATTFQAEGIYLTTARAASNGTAPGVLNYPIQGVAL